MVMPHCRSQLDPNNQLQNDSLGFLVVLEYSGGSCVAVPLLVTKTGMIDAQGRFTRWIIVIFAAVNMTLLFFVKNDVVCGDIVHVVWRSSVIDWRITFYVCFWSVGFSDLWVEVLLWFLVSMKSSWFVPRSWLSSQSDSTFFFHDSIFHAWKWWCEWGILNVLYSTELLFC